MIGRPQRTHISSNKGISSTSGRLKQTPNAMLIVSARLGDFACCSCVSGGFFIALLYHKNRLLRDILAHMFGGKFACRLHLRKRKRCEACGQIARGVCAIISKLPFQFLCGRALPSDLRSGVGARPIELDSCSRRSSPGSNSDLLIIVQNSGNAASVDTVAEESTTKMCIL